jgi:hypothetical protein
MDLDPWILLLDLGQPSQTSDHGKNVKASINCPICRRGQCNQSTVGVGARRTTSRQQRSTLLAQVCLHLAIWTKGQPCECIVMYVHNLSSLYFSPQVKNKPYETKGELVLFLRTVLLQTVTCKLCYVWTLLQINAVTYKFCIQILLLIKLATYKLWHYNLCYLAYRCIYKLFAAPPGVR